MLCCSKSRQYDAIALVGPFSRCGRSTHKKGNIFAIKESREVEGDRC